MVTQSTAGTVGHPQARGAAGVACAPGASASDCASDCRKPCCRETVIAARGLRVMYAGGICALDSVAIDVVRGEHVAILGASGSGKTTLLRCLANRLAPQEGVIECHGRIATIHQDLRLVRQVSARRNVLHGSLGRHSLARSLRFPAAERQRAGELLHRVGLEGRASLRASRLSGGEQQRVAIARALMQDPCILLADEPVASLDEANARNIMALLRDLCREHNLALITVLHNPRLAEEYADRVIRLDRGRIAGEFSCCQFKQGEGAACEPCGVNGAPALGTVGELVPALKVPIASLQIPTIGGSALAAPGLKAPPAKAPPVLDSLAGGSALPTVVSTNGASANPPAGNPWGSSVGATSVPPAPPLSIPSSFEPTAGSIWRFAGIALLAIVVYAWAIRGLNITSHQIVDAGPGLLAFLRDLVPKSFAQLATIPFLTLLKALIETVQMALIGTTVGIFLAFPLAAMAARNVGPRLLQGPVRQLLNIIRTIPSLVWALVFIAAVGLGPFAGVLALTLYSLGYLTKFFYESFEAADTGPQGALAEIGATGPQRFLHAVWPAALPAAASSCLFVLEYNVRAASVLGIVDAGGIGSNIKDYLDYRNFPAVIVCLAMVLAVVIVLDAISTRVRAWAVQR